MEARSVSRLATAGAVLVMAGLLTGLASGTMANPRMGLTAHLEGLMNGMLLIAVAGVWRRRVQLGRAAEQSTILLLIGGAWANWLATLLAALWGASSLMPIAGAGHAGTGFQETVVAVLLLAASVAMIGGVAMLIRGLSRGRVH